MVGLLAGRIAFVQYRLMLRFSLRGDMMTAQMMLKNVVLLTAVLILTYGLYVPKSWRRAAMVAGPLALLPFATLCGAGTCSTRRRWRGSGRVGSMSRDPAGPPVRLRRADPARSWPSARPTGPARSPGCAGRSPRPGSWASIASGGGSAPAEWAEVYLAEHQLLKRPSP